MTEVRAIPNVDALLTPVAPGAPAGADLRYQPIYDEITSARRLADADPTELGPWRAVLDLVLKASARSRDLQLAIWLLEALSRTEGFSGVATGLAVVRRLLEEHWDWVFPGIDPDDTEPLAFRRALLDWIDDRLPSILKGMPLTAPPSSYGLLHYEVTQRTGDEKKALLDEGWPGYEQFDDALQKSPTPHLEAVLGVLTTCQDELAALQAVVDQRFNADAVSKRGATEPLRFLAMKEALDTARWIVERPLRKRGESSAQASAGAAAGVPGSLAEGGPAGQPSPGAPGLPPDAVWSEALTLTRGSRVDGLRLMQDHVAAAPSGRERFLRELQLAELSLEAGIYSLAFPVFDELARVIDARKLEEWEERTLITRVWKGLARCCELLKDQNAACAARGAEVLERLGGSEAPAAES